MTIAEIIIAGFIMGISGSLHCIGMCGPLSLVLPTAHLSKPEKLFSLSLYQIGRIVTYSAIGVAFGFTGQLLQWAGFQRWFSIIAGTAILLIALMYFLHKVNLHFIPFKKFYSTVQNSIGSILRNYNGYKSFFALGLVNGFLPCGMVYIALAAAVSLANFYSSIIFMAMFGAGTFPAMMLAGFGMRMVTPRIRNSFKNFVPVLIAITGLILILRGITIDLTSLGLPYKLAAGKIISCGH